jgi:hypothetical protein
MPPVTDPEHVPPVPQRSPGCRSLDPIDNEYDTWVEDFYVNFDQTVENYNEIY